MNKEGLPNFFLSCKQLAYVTEARHAVERGAVPYTGRVLLQGN